MFAMITNFKHSSLYLNASSRGELNAGGSGFSPAALYSELGMIKIAMLYELAQHALLLVFYASLPAFEKGADVSERKVLG